MTEQEWFTCGDPGPMLEFLRQSVLATERRLRLLVVACCRAVWDRLGAKRSRRAVECAERYADGLATVEDLIHSGSRARQAAQEALSRSIRGGLQETNAIGEAERPIFLATVATRLDLALNFPDFHEICFESQLKTLSPAILRCIFGCQLWRFTEIMDSWLSWRDGTVRRLAQAIYTERILPSGIFDNAGLNILGDALEEAGCENRDMLNHCREPGVHVRGCWLIDRLLSKD